MATSGDDVATFGINLEGNAATKAQQLGDTIEGLRQRISAGQGAIKGMQNDLRNLKGSTDEVKAAKEKLKDAIANEKASLDGTKAAITTQTKSLKDLEKGTKFLAAEKAKAKKKAKELADELKDGKEKAAADRAKALGAAIGTAGGPVASLRDKLNGLKDIMGENGAGGASSLLTLGVAGLAAAALALTVAVGAAVVSLAKFVLRGADAARSMGLLREAAVGGNAQWAKNFGEQIDALALKVPTSKAKIDDLGKSLAASRIGGQIWVDTLNAVTQASAALGDEAGNKLKEFVTRGRQFNRFQLNPQELIGTGVDFKDVATALATSMHIGVADAQKALFEGRVKLGDGAKALRDSVEKKFGKINLRQMLSLDNLAVKLGEAFDALTKDIDLEPLLNAFKDLMGVLSLSTVSGQGLKQLVEVFGKELVGGISSSTPLAKQFIYGLIIGAQNLTIEYLTLKKTIKDTFAGSSLTSAQNMSLALDVGKSAAVAITAAIGLAAAALAAAAAPVALLIGGFIAIDTFAKRVGRSVRETFIDIDWKATGSNIVDGLIEGIKSGAVRINEAILDLGTGVKDTFKSALGIHSPSTVFAEYGEDTTAGYEKGVQRGSAGAQSSVDSMVSVPKGGGSRAGGGPVTVNMTFNVSGSNAKEIASQLSTDSILEQIVKAIVDASQGGGFGVPA